MTGDQLHKANQINTNIELINDLEKEVEQFKKQRFCGTLPVAVSRFIAKDGQVALKVCEMITAMAIAKREALQKQLDSL